MSERSGTADGFTDLHFSRGCLAHAAAMPFRPASRDSVWRMTQAGALRRRRKDRRSFGSSQLSMPGTTEP